MQNHSEWRVLSKETGVWGQWWKCSMAARNCHLLKEAAGVMASEKLCTEQNQQGRPVDK